MSESLPKAQSGFWSRFQKDSAEWMRVADILAATVAIVLPWSTSLVAIAIVLWVLALIPTLNLKRLREILLRPECAIPVALFAVAVIGTLWASDIPWAARLHGINPVAKLLVIPLLIYHFETSSRGLWVMLGFLVSCIALMLLSWPLYATGRVLNSVTPGVPVKDYIAQSQEFVLCAFGLAGVALVRIREGRRAVAYLLFALALAFIGNIIFVATSRTALVCIPILFLVACLKYFGPKSLLIALVAVGLIAGCVWNVAPSLRDRVNSVVLEYKAYKNENAITSTGQRLEYWRKSIAFVEQAPLFGHGTGSIRTLFEQAAIGQTGVSSDVVNNPHNQTFNVAIQWGLAGVILLYAMWLMHIMLFQSAGGLAAWIGLIAVVENVVSSLFNSHIFDFVQGWIYVVAVGLSAGMMRQRASSAPLSAQSLAIRADAA